MSGPETRFTGRVHAHLPAGRHDPYYMKNNNLYTSGIWDCWYSGHHADLWIEYKFEPLPLRDSTIVPIDLSALQLDWGLNRHEEGRNLAVVIGSPMGGVIFVHREWEHPLTKAEFMKRILTPREIAEFIIGVTQG